MKVKIIRPTFVNGKLAQAGETIDVPETEARALISAKKAVDGTTAKVERATGNPQKD